jgi:hypothetical protein
MCLNKIFVIYLGKPLCFIKNVKKTREDAILNEGFNAVCGLDCMTAQCEPIWETDDNLRGIQVSIF